MLSTFLYNAWLHHKGLIAAIGQGVLSLTGVKTKNRELLINGRKITGSYDAIIQQKLQETGAIISTKG